jgi:hypothetical protein
MSKVWLIFRRGDNPARTQIASGVDLLVVKKDRSNGSYVTNDLSKNLLPQFAKDASPTTLNSGSVLSILLRCGVHGALPEAVRLLPE